MGSYVGSKKNLQWLWLVMHSKARQVVAMQIGTRDRQTAEKLFFKRFEPLKKAYYYTAYFNVYYDTIPARQHGPVGKESANSSYIKRLNCWLRQRGSRLVRKTRSYSKKLLNHIGMILYLICDYNLHMQAFHV